MSAIYKQRAKSIAAHAARAVFKEYAQGQSTIAFTREALEQLLASLLAEAFKAHTEAVIAEIKSRMETGDGFPIIFTRTDAS